MTLLLPRLPRTTAYTLRPMRSGKVLRSATGAARLPVSRPGDHWAIEVDAGVLKVLCGRGLIGCVLRGATNPVRVPVPQPGFDVGTPGAVRIKGASQAGTEVDLDGFWPNYCLREGRFLTIETAGSPRLYLVCEEVIADADGEATVTLWPMLHVPPADNDTVELIEPYLEGLIDEGGDHTIGLTAAAGLDSFMIEEPS